MRTISFPTGTHRTTQTTVRQVLGALERRGVRTWTGSHVVRELQEYVASYDPQPPDMNSVNYALRWLERNGYADRTLSDGGRRHVAFSIHDDVTLTLAEARGWDQYASRRTSAAADHRYGAVERPSENGSTTVTMDQPPLPFTDVPTYRLAELVAHLERWAHADRDAYADWVDQVLQQLRGAYR